ILTGSGAPERLTKSNGHSVYAIGETSGAQQGEKYIKRKSKGPLEGRIKRVCGHWVVVKYETPVSLPHFGQGKNEDDQGREGGRRVWADRDSFKVKSINTLLDELDGSAGPQIFLDEPVPKVLFGLTVEEEVVRRFNYGEANGAVGVAGRIPKGASQPSGNLVVEEAIDDIALSGVEEESPEGIPRGGSD
ncbi:hypothetical protein, partial, partial [Parasitella parasitica]